MKRRTTIEIDDELLARARRALGNPTARATIEEALPRLAHSTGDKRADRAAKQMRYLQKLGSHADLAILASEEVWR